jgi:hypothetical protein
VGISLGNLFFLAQGIKGAWIFATLAGQVFGVTTRRGAPHQSQEDDRSDLHGDTSV